MKKLVILDAGHGGYNKNTDKYECLARGKQFNHSKGVFHKGTIFYEGESNRTLAYKVESLLMQNQIPSVKTFSRYADASLQNRVEVANSQSRLAGAGHSIFVSIHSNASKEGNARGFRVYTSGSKNSTALAKEVIKSVSKECQGLFKVEANPYVDTSLFVLKNTNMEAVLIEALFFDNYEDATLLMSEEIQDKIALSIVGAIKHYLT